MYNKCGGCVIKKIKNVKKILKKNNSKIKKNVIAFFKEKDKIMYQASLKNLIAFALSAIKEKGLSKQGKKQAFWVLKQHKIKGNPYIPLKKKNATRLMKILGVFVNTKNCEI